MTELKPKRKIGNAHRFERMLQTSVDYQREWRSQCTTHYEYYDGDQWSPEDLAVLESRGQHPTVINLTRATIDIIAAMLINGAEDVSLAGRESSDDDIAADFTGLLRQVEQRSKLKHHRNQEIKDALIGGIGWLHVGVKGTKKNLKVWVKKRPWHEFYWDPYAVDPDLGDARFIARSYWEDIDVAMAQWPDKADEISNLNPGEFSADNLNNQEKNVQIMLANAPLVAVTGKNTSRRVRIVDMFYRDEEDEIHRIIFTGSVALEGDLDDDSKNVSPFDDKENFMPFIPFMAFQDRNGNPQGVVSFVSSLQETINKINSKYIHSLSSIQVMYEHGAVKDEEELRYQVSRPDTIMAVEPGALQSGAIQITKQYPELAHLGNMMQMYIGLFQRVSGVNDSLQGLGGPNARSGLQEQQRQSAGAAMQTSIFESFALSNITVAECLVKLIGQFYPESTKARILQAGQGSRLASFNDPRQVAVTDDATGELIEVKERVASIKEILEYDVLFKRTQRYGSVRTAELAAMSEVMKALLPIGGFPPQLAAQIMIENTDTLQNKDEYLKILNEFSQQAQEQQGQSPQMSLVG